jgi:hypothetical protein
MISEIVLSDLPPGMSREEALAALRRSLPRWQREPALIRKTLLYDPVAGQMGGAYLWRNREAALRAHDADWQAGIALQYGSPPLIRFFETPTVVDNALGAVTDDVSS